MKRLSQDIFKKLGILCIAAALLLTLYNICEDLRAGRQAGKALDDLQISERKDPRSGLDLAGREMPVKHVDGYDYIGILYIPSINMVLPVISETSYRHLRRAPCRFSGTVYEKNMVLGGHNYRSHFSPIKGLKINADVIFQDVEGYVYTYHVSDQITLKPTQVEELITKTDWDLSLFTCTPGGSRRCVIRCKE